MALTVVFSLLASLGVALFFIPMLASRQVHLARGDSEGQGARLMQSEVLQLRSVAWLLEGMGLKNRGENALQYHAMNFKTLLMRVPVGFAYLLGEYVARTLWLVSVIAIVALKTVFTILAVLLYPIIYPGWGFYCWIGSGPRWRQEINRLWGSLCAWAEDRHLFGKGMGADNMGRFAHLCNAPKFGTRPGCTNAMDGENIEAPVPLGLAWCDMEARIKNLTRAPGRR